MTAQAEPSDVLGRPAIVPRWLWLFGLLAALLTTAQAIGVAYMASGWAAPRGTLGINELAGCGADGYCPISFLRPGSPAARAGVMLGDRVRLDHYWERHRTLPPGESVGMTVSNGGSARHLTLVTEAKEYFAPTWIITGLASAAVSLIAFLILMRAGRRWPNFLLGGSLIGIGIPGGYPRFWQNDASLFPWFFVILAVAYMAGPVLMLAALRGFRREVTGHTPRWLDRLLWSAATVVPIATVWGTAVELDSAPILGLADGLLLTSLTWSLTSLLGPLALATGWRQVPPASRTRYAFMWLAVSVISLHALVDPLIIAAGNNYTQDSWPVVVQLVSIILGATLFAYAILRHRVVDLGFAINRTLVYSVLSFLMLMTFGLVEWASEKLLPFESVEASAVIQAAVALTLFLAFHRVHAWVEGLVERVFFHRWHANQAAMQRFLHQASYITRADTLIARTLAELKRFSGGAAVAFYRAAAAEYERVAGDERMPAKVDADLPALVAMRADRAAIRDGFGGGDLALPMIHRAEMTGFVVVGPKREGGPYRPDEETLLAEAVSRIGLDLYAFRIEELEAVNARLSAQINRRVSRKPRERAA